jgi:hypothetical protein
MKIRQALKNEWKNNELLTVDFEGDICYLNSPNSKDLEGVFFGESKNAIIKLDWKHSPKKHRINRHIVMSLNRVVLPFEDKTKRIKNSKILKLLIKLKVLKEV